MMNIGFIRHGRTAWNEEGRIQGRSDVPLSEMGMKQVKRLGQRLVKEQWNAIYSSDLKRAVSTAEEAARMLKLHVHFDPRLRERSMGRMEGLTVQERIDRWGGGWNFLDHGVEPAEQLVARAEEFLNDMIAEEQQTGSDSVLVVSHGAWIGLLLNKLIGEDGERPHLENTSLTIVEKTPKGWNSRLYNCTAHLN